MTDHIHWDSALYQEKHSFVYKHGEALLGLLVPKTGEKILDLGCGNGYLAAEIAKLGADVTGIDASPDMIVSARINYPAIDFQVMDAVSFQLPVQYDAVFSNAVLHWVSDPEAAAQRIFECLRPGGRFVAEFGGKGNNQGMLSALKEAFREYGLDDRSKISFWYFPSIAAYTTILEQAGFEVGYARLFPRPTELNDGERGVKDWFSMFGEKFFKGLDAGPVENVLDSTQRRLKATHFKEGKWLADYVRLQVVATKPLK
jgi:trans-aconitate methyltransferase